MNNERSVIEFARTGKRVATVVGRIDIRRDVPSSFNSPLNRQETLLLQRKRKLAIDKQAIPTSSSGNERDVRRES